MVSPKVDKKSPDELKLDEEKPSLDFMRRLFSRFVLISFFSYKHKDYYRVYKALSNMQLYSYPIQGNAQITPTSSPSPPPPVMSLFTTTPQLHILSVFFFVVCACACVLYFNYF